METSCWRKPTSVTVFSLCFRAFETGFPRSPLPAQRPIAITPVCSETDVAHALARPLGPPDDGLENIADTGGRVVHNHSAGRLTCAPSWLSSLHSCRELRSRTIFAM